MVQSFNGLTGSWFSGYDVSLTRRRSPVRIWPGPGCDRG